MFVWAGRLFFAAICSAVFCFPFGSLLYTSSVHNLLVLFWLIYFFLSINIYLLGLEVLALLDFTDSKVRS